MANCKPGCRPIARAHGAELQGIGLDTWGVDFALLGRDDELLGNPRHYRDARTEGMMAAAFERVPRTRSLQPPASSSCRSTRSTNCWPCACKAIRLLDQAQTLLMMPDLFNYWLTGVKVCEFTDRHHQPVL